MTRHNADRESSERGAAPLSRRSVLQGLAAGAALAAVPVRWFDAAVAAEPAKKGVFGYGVASGDPTASAIIVWTRATPSPDATPGSGNGAPVTVRWELAGDEAFTTVVRTGVVTTGPERDHTVKVDVTGLSPYTRYFYRFLALGATSAVGRTQTAPTVDGVDHALRLAFVSCSNYTGGYFTAYRAIAQRDDLDFVLHLGDYIYEYGNGADRYGPASLAGKRDGQPATEILSLKDYRLRHALHKADPDLQAAHQRIAWITTLDDHEVANNQWTTGAENHQPNEGSFTDRRAVAYQAYLEWMPIRPAPVPDPVPHGGQRWFRRFSYGTLADLTVLETRQNRSEQINMTGASTKGGGFIPSATPGLTDPTRHLPEPEQLTFLLDGMAGTGHAWHLVGNNVVFTPNQLPGDLLGVPGANLINSDAWDGYQADQSAVISHAAALPKAAGDTVFMTGDIHSSWVFDVPADTKTYAVANNSVFVEFVGPSITSDGFKEIFGGNAQALALTTAVTATNPWLKKLDGIGHGYCVLDVTRARVQCDWYFLVSPMDDPRIDPAATTAYAFSYQTLAGSRRVSAVEGPVSARRDQPEAVRAPRRDEPATVSSTGSENAAPSRGELSSLPTTGLPVALPATAAVVAAAAQVLRRRLRETSEETDSR